MIYSSADPDYRGKMAQKTVRGKEIDELPQILLSGPGKVDASWIHSDLPQFLADKFKEYVLKKVTTIDEFKSQISLREVVKGQLIKILEIWKGEVVDNVLYDLTQQIKFADNCNRDARFNWYCTEIYPRFLHQAREEGKLKSGVEGEAMSNKALRLKPEVQKLK